tara:strand:- start:113 stop:400 length:288 start_codon:yes stop_codon:yes gene_type:complete
MSNKILKIIVIILTVLIIISFIALVYGMYIKISTSSEKMPLDQKSISLKLKNNEEIIDIKVINQNNLLIIIRHSGKIKGGIFNIKKNKIENYIEK